MYTKYLFLGVIKIFILQTMTHPQRRGKKQPANTHTHIVSHTNSHRQKIYRQQQTKKPKQTISVLKCFSQKTTPPPTHPSKRQHPRAPLRGRGKQEANNTQKNSNKQKKNARHSFCIPFKKKYSKNLQNTHTHPLAQKNTNTMKNCCVCVEIPLPPPPFLSSALIALSPSVSATLQKELPSPPLPYPTTFSSTRTKRAVQKKRTSLPSCVDLCLNKKNAINPTPPTHPIFLPPPVPPSLSFDPLSLPPLCVVCACVPPPPPPPSHQQKKQ